MIFVDTSAWYARLITSDADHPAVAAWFESNRQPLVTSDYVVCETLTLLRARRYLLQANDLGTMLIDDRLARIEPVSPGDFVASWRLFSRVADQRWSFTDCTSKIVMERLGVKSAVALDDHFHQFSLNVVYPYLSSNE